VCADVTPGAETSSLYLENTKLPDQEKTNNFVHSQAIVNYQSLINLSHRLSVHSALLKLAFITTYIWIKNNSMSILSNINGKQTQYFQFSRVLAQIILMVGNTIQ